jgi:hypothetical protein
MANVQWIEVTADNTNPQRCGGCRRCTFTLVMIHAKAPFGDGTNLEDDPEAGALWPGMTRDGQLYPQVGHSYLAYAAKDFSRRRGGPQTERSNFTAACRAAVGQVAITARSPGAAFYQPMSAGDRGLTIGAVQTPGELPRRPRPRSLHSRGCEGPGCGRQGRPEVSSFEEAQVTKPCLAWPS